MKRNTPGRPTAHALLEYIKGTASDPDRTTVEAWLGDDLHNRAVLDGMTEIYYSQLRYARIRNRDAEKAYGKVLKRIRRRAVLPGITRRSAAAAAVGFLVAGSIALGLTLYGKLASKDDFIILSSNTEKKVEYTLPDGTTVYLNRNSRIKFPVNYSSSSRNIELEGEGYFEVTRDPNNPFTVTTPAGVSVRVLGTKFNLEAFAGDSIVQTTLIEGSVAVSFDDRRVGDLRYVMKPTEKLRYNSSSGSLNLETTPYSTSAMWMDDVFVFRNTLLPEVVRQLSHNFNVDFEIADRDLDHYLFTGTFRNRNLSVILDYMKISSVIEAEARTVDGRTKIILRKRR